VGTTTELLLSTSTIIVYGNLPLNFKELI
jgi:hypothetical protein